MSFDNPNTAAHNITLIWVSAAQNYGEENQWGGQKGAWPNYNVAQKTAWLGIV